MGWEELGMGTMMGMGLQCRGWAEETAQSRAGLQGPHSAVHEQGQPWVCMVPRDGLGPRDKSVSAWLWLLTPAAVPRGVPVVARLALGTVGPRRVVEAAQAAPRAPVARLWVRHIDVIVALAGQAAPVGLQRVPVVPGGTLVTAGTCRHRALGSARGWGTPKGTKCAAAGTHLCTRGCSGR